MLLRALQIMIDHPSYTSCITSNGDTGRAAPPVSRDALRAVSAFQQRSRRLRRARIHAKPLQTPIVSGSLSATALAAGAELLSWAYGVRAGPMRTFPWSAGADRGAVCWPEISTE